jgi:hypothetical protein
MDKTIRQYINLNTKTHLLNSLDLVNKIKDIDIPHNSTLASFDITNLYTNIPVSETLNILEKLLIKQQTPKDHITEIIDTLKVITQQNYFVHNNKFYIQEEGLPMGSPISSVLAEVFLQHIEETRILNNNKHAGKIIYWYRTVTSMT